MFQPPWPLPVTRYILSTFLCLYLLSKIQPLFLLNLS